MNDFLDGRVYTCSPRPLNCGHWGHPEKETKNLETGISYLLTFLANIGDEGIWEPTSYPN
jgi:hypothetical protein